ncbi:MAG: ParA family protein [Gammaproteobacteria bacterium]|nr:ParA family protein [Gammaproteobacteria bacterium]NNC98244.1 ParA family protein [Gammaproteobacteria bacterium]NNM14317.1 ParA family protein [Gammaproteobacteria bacterium]
MRHILVINPKGGSGKSTVATNLAAHYAHKVDDVALVDFDSQASSLDWLERRSERYPEIVGLAGFEDGMRGVNRGTDIVIIDAPARTHKTELTDLVNRAETIVIPVQPSPIDMDATAKFLDELSHYKKIKEKKVKVGLVANRFRENTLVWDKLDEFLEKQKPPYIAAFREAQNYIRAYTRGLGINELPEYLAWPDQQQWEPLIEWLDSKRSQPK